MNTLKVLTVAILCSLSFFASAHPGRTASDGCHYCRTNCESWGVPQDQRHCHNGINDEKLISEHGHGKGHSHESPKLETELEATTAFTDSVPSEE